MFVMLCPETIEGLWLPQFQKLCVPFASAISTLTAVAMSGGRLDAILAMGTHAEVLGLVRGVRDLSDALVFRGGVRVRTTPFVVYTLDSRDVPWTATDNWVFHYAGSSPNWRTFLVDVIQLWRDSVITELDYIGFAVTSDASGSVQVSHALQRRRREGEILAPAGTPGSLRDNQYLVLSEDMLEHFATYAELKHLLENYQSMAAVQNVQAETLFQRFFEKNPHLVRRSLFGQIWAKPRLRRPETPGRYIAPDFVLKPLIGAHLGTNWEILDLKLPNDELVTSPKFHPAYSAKLTKAMQQLRNYRNYFGRQDERVRAELVARFGYQPLHPRIAVLIGRRQHEEGLDRIQGDAGDLDIDVITYDDVVEFEESRLILQGTIAGLFSA